MEKSKFPLIRGVVQKSNSVTWDEAKLEWELVDIYESNEPESCLCGHYPIKEICVLKNKLNQNTVEVGNCCVKKIWNFSSDKIFRNIKEIKKNILKSLNPDLLNFALKKNIISNSDYKFYIDIWRKRVLSVKQEKWKTDINKRVLSKIKF